MSCPWIQVLSLCSLLCPLEAFTNQPMIEYWKMIVDNGPLIGLGRGESFSLGHELEAIAKPHKALKSFKPFSESSDNYVVHHQERREYIMDRLEVLTNDIGDNHLISSQFLVI